MTRAHAHIEIPLWRRESTLTIIDNYVLVMLAAVAHFFSLSVIIMLNGTHVEIYLSFQLIFFCGGRGLISLVKSSFPASAIDFPPSNDRFADSLYSSIYTFFLSSLSGTAICH